MAANPGAERPEKSLQLRKKLVDDSPNFPEHRIDLAVVASELAYLLIASDPAAAETVARETLEGLAKLADHQPPVPSYLNALGRAIRDGPILLTLPDCRY